ncbi:MAG TPA: methionyl-tRNA formyltransferase [Anaerolineales bacterium]|nr:methionyl-tRNA formyltransferase [Anaerolineales bacterium]HRQ91506.1 methionyl-tRNA formyltransferase [Anaerolineales bacterium]
MTKRVVFMGSPDFARPSLQALARLADASLVGVVTQPDRPAGRGRQLTPPPVKTLALELGLPLMQPERLRAKEPMEQLRDWAPDLIVVAAFGQILRPAVLDMPTYGCINVHASLLPRWRGASPIVAAILHGDAEAGVTIMKMDPGMDTGPMLSKRSILIQDEDTAASLSDKLSILGADLLLDTLPGYLDGSVQPQPQPEAGVTLAPLLEKSVGQLDPHAEPAELLARKVRAFNPWPIASLPWKGGALRILRSHAIGGQGGSPGRRIVQDGLPAVVTTAGVLVLDEVQPAGKKAMSGRDFLLGVRDWPE